MIIVPNPTKMTNQKISHLMFNKKIKKKKKKKKKKKMCQNNLNIATIKIVQ